MTGAARMTWHIDQPTAQAYADGQLDPATEASVDAHLVACTRCQQQTQLETSEVEPLWRAVHTEITTPRLSAPLRTLARLGVPHADLVVIDAARDLTASWSTAVGAAMVCAFVVGLAPVPFPGGPQALFLVLAPLIPVLAVVAAYDATDPFREILEASPFSALRHALLRTAAALTAAIPLTVAISLTVPGLHGYFATWLLPGLLLTVTSLTLLTWLTAWAAGGVVGAGWIVAATIAAEHGSLGVVATSAGQLAVAAGFVALTVVCVRVTTVQHVRGIAR